MSTIIKKFKSVIEVKKTYAFSLVFCYVFGLLLGIIFFGNQEKIMLGSNVIDFFVLALSKDGSLTELLFSRLLNAFASFFLFALCGLALYLYPIHFIIVIYRGYVLGVAFLTFISGFGVTGAVLFVFGVLLQNIVTTLCLIVLSTLLLDMIKTAKKCKSLNYQWYFVVTIIMFLVALIGIIIEFILLCFIIRPLNFYF